MERAAASAPAIGQDYLYDTLGTLYISDANLAGALGAYRRRVLVNPNHGDARAGQGHDGGGANPYPWRRASHRWDASGVSGAT